MRLTPLQLTDLEDRQYLPWNVYSMDGVLLLHQGASLDSEGLKENLTERGFRKVEPIGIASGSPTVLTYDRIDQLVGQWSIFIKEPAPPRRLEQPAERLWESSRLVRSWTRDHFEAALAWVHLHQDDPSLAIQSVQKAILASLLAHQEQLLDHEHEGFVLAALTADWGFEPLHRILCHQKTPLTLPQIDELHDHPKYSVERLAAWGITDKKCVRAVREHHERLDGNGYPQQLKSIQISWGGRALAVLDSYLAMLRPAVHRTSKPSLLACKELFLANKALDPSLAAAVIKLVGFYPIGTLLELNDNRVAVVVKVDSTKKIPTVVPVSTTSRLPLRNKPSMTEAFLVNEPRQIRGVLAAMQGRSFVPNALGLWNRPNKKHEQTAATT